MTCCTFQKLPNHFKVNASTPLHFNTLVGTVFRINIIYSIIFFSIHTLQPSCLMVLNPFLKTDPTDLRASPSQLAFSGVTRHTSITIRRQHLGVYIVPVATAKIKTKIKHHTLSV